MHDVTCATFVAKEECHEIAHRHQFSGRTCLYIDEHLLGFAQFLIDTEGIGFLLSWGVVEKNLKVGVLFDELVKHPHHAVLVPHFRSQFGSDICQHNGFGEIDALLLQVVAKRLLLFVGDVEGKLLHGLDGLDGIEG